MALNQQSHPRQKVAVIGAGISGLACARQLLEHGMQVTVFEKSRGVGGRMATRRTPEGLQFDHGAQYFTVRDERFQRYTEDWVQNGLVERWEGRIATLTHGEIELKAATTQRLVGTPRMNAVCRQLAEELPVQFRTQVAPPERKNGQWHIRDTDNQRLGDFDILISSAPAPQSAQLLAYAPDLRKIAEQAKMAGCWSVLLAFEQPVPLPFDGAFVHDSPLSWISRNSSKPARSDAHDCWVLHAAPAWSDHHIDEEPDAIFPILMEAFWEATGISKQSPSYSASHRWRFAIPHEPLVERCLFNPQRAVGACGDWCNSPRVEGAFLSGLALAEQVLGHVSG